MTQNPFQPWKQTFNLPNQFYRKNDTESSSTFNKVKNGDAGPSAAPMSVLSPPFELSSDSQTYQTPVTSSSSAILQGDIEQQPSPKPSQSGTKFSIFSQLLNLNKINAFDNLLLNASVSLDDEDLNSDKRQGIRKLMEQAISDDAKQQIAFILEKISALRPAEKLLLYLKMPGGHSEVDPLKQSQNPLGSRSEISHTINWVRSHLEHDEKVSIPKQEVYEDYVSFCSKINIKPLSTADFGKVMKQVFPDIRPRRLGTRGHSRYCYAAMRKATKLQPPYLPDLSTQNASSTKDADNDGAWKVIKSWSESLLNNEFESADDLASHISQHKLNLPSGSSSKQLLQKKLMQREMKERRRNINQSLKKRRKKRRKSTESPESLVIDEYYDDNIQIKQEKETDGSAVENNYSEDSSDEPMNLTSTEQARRVQSEMTLSTNHVAIPSQYNGDANESIKSKLKQKINEAANASSSDMHHDDNQYVICKKVRQAQQLKMSANVAALTHIQENAQTSPQVINSETAHEMLMPSKIPSKRKQRKDNVMAMKRTRYPDKGDADNSTPQTLNQVEPNDLVVKKDDLKEDFILPRERFISICNMDRNALDTYLNANEENSQDLELLQYFGEDKTRNSDCIEEDLGPANTSVPLLENYQLYNENKGVEKNSEKISQLRSMLEEKYNVACTPNPSNESVIKNFLLKNGQQSSGDLSNCEMNDYGTAAVSYGNMSQRHGPQQHNLPQHIRNYQADNSVSNGIPQSPNTRRKNFSFVPIPTQSSGRAKNINLHPAFKGDVPTSPFVSPRATPVNRRVNPFLNIRNPNGSNESKSTPVLGNNNTAFCRPHQFKMEPASAPQSPSMLQSYNYSPQAQQNQFQFQPLNNNQGTNYNYPVESRSQSVPPHCTNTNMYNSYTSYSSACSSMAPTPVPSDYQEFSDTNILDIFNSEQAQTSSAIKMEANDDVIDLLDNEILNQNSGDSQSIRQTFANSRSVPNTPLPYHVGYNNMNSFCPVGKSVPTTPIGMNGGNPFRYSPELQRTRDFLINGFNNNNNNVVNNNINKISKDGDGSLSNDIDELSNIDTSLLNNL